MNIDFLTLLNWLFQSAIAFVATIAFAIIFHTPQKQYLFTGITGGVGWLVYLVSVGCGCGVVSASFFATVTLTWLSRIFSFKRKSPVTVFLICGIFPLVPGAGIYYTGYYFFMGDNSLAAGKGLETIKIAIAIALGIGIVLSLPPVLFSFHRAKSSSKTNNTKET